MTHPPTSEPRLDEMRLISDIECAWQKMRGDIDDLHAVEKAIRAHERYLLAALPPSGPSREGEACMNCGMFRFIPALDLGKAPVAGPSREEVEAAITAYGDACYDVGFVDADRESRTILVSDRNALRAALLAMYRPAGETVQAIRDKAFCEAINILRTHFVSGSVLERQYAMAADTLRGLLGKSTAEIDAILAQRPAAPAGETRAGDMTQMRRFTVYRRGDLSATHNDQQAAPPDAPQYEGVVFSDGRVALRWLTPLRSVSVWDSMDDALGVHGHPEPRYGTELVWHDAATTTPTTSAE